MFYGSSTNTSHLNMSKNKLKRQSRTFTQVLYRKLSYRERRCVTDLPADLMDDPAELSIQLSAPGILKIFGNEICTGANYKSVLATPMSSAQELVKEALERYSVSKRCARQYVLCDAIGRLDGANKRWRTECLRALGDNEKPLLLQDLWKPKEGFARRFELRHRAEVEEIAAREKDTTTADINAQARKLQRNRAKGNNPAMSGCTYELLPLRRSVSETSLTLAGNQAEEQQQRLYSTLPGLPVRRSKKERLHTASSKKEQKGNVQDPLVSVGQLPHLLLLQGYNHPNDGLVYPLDGESHIVGRETASAKPNICLLAPDILPLHCRVRRVRGAKAGEQRVLELEPFPDARVSVSLSQVEQATALRHGDLVGFGRCYLFLFRDPQRTMELPAHTHSLLRNLHRPAQPRAPHSRTTCQVCGSVLWDSPSAGGELLPVSAIGESSANCGDGGGTQRKRLQLEYHQAFEELLVDKILTLIEPCADDHKLTPACLLCLCVQHSASSFQPGQVMKLLLRIADKIQAVAWEKTRELAEKQSEHQDTTTLPLLSIADLVPDLQHIFFWMSNSIELLYFIQQKVPDYIQGIEDLDHSRDIVVHLAGSKESLLSCSISANEEVMTILEEVIMHTFQQCVYYITKALYVALPAFLDCNPFQTEIGGSWESSSSLPELVRNVMQIYQTTLDLLHQYEVHPEIAAQMFAYLFFFSNASLFNQLMDRGSRQGFFHWTRGEQMQASLRLLLEWIRNVGMGNIAEEFFSKFSSAVRLLAVPTSCLIQTSWHRLKREFQPLNPSQMLHILTHYQLAPGVVPNESWQPKAKERAAIYQTEDIMLSFDKYPPIVLPTSNFKVDLEADTIDDNVYRHLLYIRHFLWSLRTRFQTTHGQSILEVPVQETEFPLSHSPHQLRSDSPAALSGHKVQDHHSSQINHRSSSGLEAEMDGRDSSTSWLSGSHRQFNPCQELKEKLHNLQLQNSLGRHRLPGQSMQPLDPSCLLTPPNTPLNCDLGHNDFMQTNGEGDRLSNTRRDGLCRNGANEREGRMSAAFDLLTPKSSSRRSAENDSCHVFVVELERGPIGLGMGLIDGMHTTLNSPGIYIRTLLPDSPAAYYGRLSIGDRILAVNGTSLIGADYDSAVNLIRMAGERPRFLVAKSDFLITEKISASSC
uniref:Ras association and DIL domains n=2 Tax=Callorhinchus milii TaxID=7868 RepID=A0A4W3KE40_CALMI|eukprot:gi/632975615/ref/XP_007904325.1/ PREDICTED: ras-associating and dilute domain-containing protein isoform X1 [Callorhinchus milii]